MTNRRLQLVDRITDLASEVLRDFPEEPRVAGMLYSLAGAVAIGEPWITELNARVMEHTRAFLDSQDLHNDEVPS